MERSKSEDRLLVFNAFWYSLDVFAPVIDLETAKYWKPKPDQTFARHYLRVQRILGWIIIPIAGATILGLIK